MADELNTQGAVNWQMRLGIIAIFTALITMGYKYVGSMDKIIEQQNEKLIRMEQREERLIKMATSNAFILGQESITDSLIKN